MGNAWSMSLVSGPKGHHGVKPASNYHPGCWIWALVLTINFSFFVRNYGSFWVCWKLEICRCSLLSRSNLDWVGERGDLPRIEHSIHSNFPRLKISLLQFREFPLHIMCAQWWLLLRSRGIQDVQMCRTAAYSWRFIMIHIHSLCTTYVYRYINIYLKTLCLMLCMEFCLFDLTVMKANVVANQWPWSLRDVFADTAAHVQSLVTAHHHHKALERIRQFWQNLSS